MSPLHISAALCFHQNHCGGVGLSLVFGPTQPSKPGSSSPTQLNFTSVHPLKSQDYPLENKRQSGNKSRYWRKIPFVFMLKWFLEFEGGMVETFQLNDVHKCPASILKTCRWSWKGNLAVFFLHNVAHELLSSSFLPPPCRRFLKHRYNWTILFNSAYVLNSFIPAMMKLSGALA